MTCFFRDTNSTAQFTGKVEKRKKAIDNINNTTLEKYGASILKKDSVESHLEELSRLYQ